MEQQHKEGWLVKAPMSVGSRHGSLLGGLSGKKSQRRFFVLQGNVLEYFDKVGAAKAKGSLELSSKSIVKASDAGASLVVIPYPGSKRELVLWASDPKEACEWAVALLAACKLGPDADEEEEKDVDSNSDAEGDPGAESEASHSDADSAPPASPRASDAPAALRLSLSLGAAKKAAGAEPEVPEWKREWAQRVQRRTHLPRHTYKVIKEGVLDKQTEKEAFSLAVLDGYWSARFFVLTDVLEYFESEEARDAGRAGTRIPLESVAVSKRDIAGSTEFCLYTIGANYTLRCATEEDRDEWVLALANCHSLLERADLPRRGSVAKERKVVPDFLVGIKDRVQRPKAQLHPEPPPPAPEDDGAAIKHTSTPDILEGAPCGEQGLGADCGAPTSDGASAVAKQVDSGASGEGGADESACAISSPSIEEDRFAKLRAMRAARQ